MEDDELEKSISEAYNKYGEDLVKWLKTMVKVEEKLLEESKGEWHDWEWHDVMIKPHILRDLAFIGVIKIAYKSRSHTAYELVDRESTSS